jgi:hypothetical protein
MYSFEGSLELEKKAVSVTDLTESMVAHGFCPVILDLRQYLRWTRGIFKSFGGNGPCHWFPSAIRLQAVELALVQSGNQS